MRESTHRSATDHARHDIGAASGRLEAGRAVVLERASASAPMSGGDTR